MQIDQGKGLSGLSTAGQLSSAERLRLVLLALGVLMTAVFPAIALAESSNGNPNPPAELTPQLVQEAVEGSGQMAPTPETDPSAAESLSRNSLGRDEAMELATSVFGAAVETPAGIFDGMPEGRFLDSHTAVMPRNAISLDTSGSASRKEKPGPVQCSLNPPFP